MNPGKHTFSKFSTMKSVVMSVVGGPDVLRILSSAIPRPGPHDILIQARAIGVGMVDVLIRTGAYAWMPPLPTSPGSDLAGVVTEVGSETEGIAVGDHVLITARDLPVRGGCYAEYISVPARAVYRLPPHVDFAQAVALSNYQVALALLTDAAGGAAVKRLVVTGVAGGVGSAVADLGRSRGYQVLGTVSSAAKAEFACAAGAHHAINYRTHEPIAEVLRITANEGVNLVLDHVGGDRLLENLHMLSPFGLLVSFNAFGAPTSGDILNRMRNPALPSVAIRCFSFHTYDGHPARRRALMTEVVQCLANGLIDPKVGAKLPLTDAAEAHRLIERGEVLGKVVLIPEMAGL